MKSIMQELFFYSNVNMLLSERIQNSCNYLGQRGIFFHYRTVATER